MKKISAALYAWGEWKIKELSHNPYSDTNILYRYAREGDIQTMPARDKILCYDGDVSAYIHSINRAWLSLPDRQKNCVFGKYSYTWVLKDDGNPRTAREVAMMADISYDTFKQNVSYGVKAIDGRVEL